MDKEVYNAEHSLLQQLEFLQNDLSDLGERSDRVMGLLRGGLESDEPGYVEYLSRLVDRLILVLDHFNEYIGYGLSDALGDFREEYL